MSIGERIKILRKDHKMNQSEFGERIGVKYSTVGLWENGQRSVSDAVIFLICEKYGVNEKWLRDGVGEMFNETNSSILSQLADEYSLDPLSEKIVGAFLKLKPEQRKAVNAYVMNLVDSIVDDRGGANKHDDSVSSNVVSIAAMGDGVKIVEEQQIHDDLYGED